MKPDSTEMDKKKKLLVLDLMDVQEAQVFKYWMNIRVSYE